MGDESEGTEESPDCLISLFRRPGLRKVRLTFGLLFLEGAFALAYETWIGPTYLSGFAGEAKVSVGMLALLTALPWVGQAGQVLGLFAFQRASSVRRYVLRVAGFARALWWVPFLTALFLGEVREGWFYLLALTATVAALCSSASSMAWLAWVKALIPPGFHGRFFGARQRSVMMALILSNGFAALMLKNRGDGDLTGYFWLLLAALGAATLSTWLLSRVPDVNFDHHEGSVQEQIVEVFRRPEALTLILLGAVFTGIVQLAGPYFPYFFTHELGMEMGTISLWTIASNLGSFAFSGYWGKILDRRPQALRKVLTLCGILIGFSPVPYIFLSVDTLRWFGPLEYFINGAAWAGFNLAIMSSAFRWIPVKLSAAFFSVYTLCLGGMGALSAATGGWIAETFVSHGGFRFLWGVGSGVRILTLAIAVQGASRILKKTGKWREFPPL